MIPKLNRNCADSFGTTNILGSIAWWWRDGFFLSPPQLRAAREQGREGLSQSGIPLGGAVEAGIPCMRFVRYRTRQRSSNAWESPYSSLVKPRFPPNAHNYIFVTRNNDLNIRLNSIRIPPPDMLVLDILTDHLWLFWSDAFRVVIFDKHSELSSLIQ